MKKLTNLCFLAMALLVVSCEMMPVSKTEYNGVRSANDSLMTVIIAQQNDLAELVSTLNATSQKLDEVNGQISVKTNDENLVTQRERLIQQLDNLQQQVAAKQKLMTSLQKKYDGVLKANKELKKCVERMQGEIAGYQARIAKYEGMISEKTAQIEQLSSSLISAQETNEQLEEELESKSSTITGLKDELNTGYYIVGTKAELKQLGLIEGGIFNKKRLTTKGFDVSDFTRIDIRELTELPMESNEATLLSPVPEDSYELVKGVDKNLTLRILDQKAFWSNSKFLVIMI